MSEEINLEEEQNISVIPLQQAEHEDNPAHENVNEDQNEDVEGESDATKPTKYRRHEPPVPMTRMRVPVLQNSRCYNLANFLLYKFYIKLDRPEDVRAAGAALNSKDKSIVCLDLKIKGPLYGPVFKIKYDKCDYEFCTTERFKLIDIHKEITGMIVANIEILPDIHKNSPLSTVQLPSLRKHEPPTIAQQKLIEDIINYEERIGYDNLLHKKFPNNQKLWKKTKHKLESVNSAMTPYPAWLYRHCDNNIFIRSMRCLDLKKRKSP